MEGSWIVSKPLFALGNDLSPERPTSGPDPTMRLSDFVVRLEAIAASSTNPLAIWRAGEVMPLPDLGPLGGPVALAPTLGAAVRAYQRGFGALQSTSAVAFEVTDDTASFHYRILDNDIWPRRADAELTLGVVAGMVRRFAPEASHSCNVAFEHEPQAAGAALASHMGAVARVSETNAISFPARLLDRPATAAMPDTTAAFRQAMHGLQVQIHADWMRQPASHRVLHTLLERIGQEATDQDAIARHLGVSRRTLRRQLDTEGTSFQELMEVCRRNVGLALLVRSDLPMIEIAMRLGYSDHTAFSRAFSRWFGASPRALRKAGSTVSVTT
ncbi:AraC family transcriptional regulator [Paracoccus sp. Z118]|uniref:AraC-like transcriptional regulator QhpR n=1 Tax=Paracoccus sp. Z118 TaxID=2851017 RepID=UPI001C2B94CF|nr:AraC family transcriptional regulator [Paracoccus sp. Z118]